MHPVMPAVAYELIEVTSGRRCGIFMNKFTAVCVGEMLETDAVTVPTLEFTHVETEYEFVPQHLVPPIGAASEQRKGRANNDATTSCKINHQHLPSCDQPV
jgi:hypothetical protein